MKAEFFIRHAVFMFTVLCVGLFLFSVALFGYRISRNSVGVCEAEGRVLSPDEHRQATLRSLVELEFETGRIQEMKFNNGRKRVGVIRGLVEPDFIPLLKIFSKNDHSFEENYQINVMPLESGFSKAYSVSEPFVLVAYDVIRGGMATFTESESVVRYQQDDVIKNSYKPTLFERYQGFGNNYYSVKRTIINRECCDNKKYSGSGEEYLSRKRRMYLDSLMALEKGWAVHRYVAVLSNCGDVLTENDGSESYTKTIKRIRGE
jgi:hypothetical protein